jgi:hypothetical protein
LQAWNRLLMRVGDATEKGAPGMDKSTDVTP